MKGMNDLLLIIPLLPWLAVSIAVLVLYRAEARHQARQRAIYKEDEQ
jgi:hypothetical protein